MSFSNKRLFNYLMPVMIFFFISTAYFVPDILEGNQIQQHNILPFKGMSKEVNPF